MVSPSDFRSHGSGNFSEPIVGDVYTTRTFAITHNNRLSGISYAQEFKPGINNSSCPTGGHSAPDPDCTCGFYSYDDESKWWMGGSEPIWGQVRAVVKISGKTVLCQKGVRSEQIEIVGLATREDDRIKKILHKFYKVPVYSSTRSLIKNHPVNALHRPEQSLKQKISQGLLGSNPKKLYKSILGSIAFVLIPLLCLKGMRFFESQINTSEIRLFQISSIIVPLIAFALSVFIKKKLPPGMSALGGILHIMTNSMGYYFRGLLFIYAGLITYTISRPKLANDSSLLKEYVHQIRTNSQDSAKLEANTFWDFISLIQMILGTGFIITSILSVIFAMMMIVLTGKFSTPFIIPKRTSKRIGTNKFRTNSKNKFKKLQYAGKNLKEEIHRQKELNSNKHRSHHGIFSRKYKRDIRTK